MKRLSLIHKLAAEQNISITVAKKVVDTVFLEMTDALVRGDRIEVRGFGSFKVKEYDAYQGRNPTTGEAIHVPEKKLPFFKVGRDLKERVDIPIKELPKSEKSAKSAKKTRGKSSRSLKT